MRALSFGASEVLGALTGGELRASARGGWRCHEPQGLSYVDDFSFRTLTGNEQLAIPYSYKVR
jgi:hypothetical protein